jgi:predicted methyltransferase
MFRRPSAPLSLAVLTGLSALALASACSSPPPPEPPPPPPPPPAQPAAKVEEPPPPPPEPTPEEKKKAEAAQKLVADFEKLEVTSKAEAERWTPELRKEVKALAEKSYPDLKTALKAVLASKHRRPDSAARDQYRHPAETLAFFGVKPTSKVFEYGPGEGWYTELLAPTLAAKGKLVVNTLDPAGSKEVRGTLYAQRLSRFLTNGAEVYGKVQPVITSNTEPKLGDEGALDVALVIRGLHGMYNQKTMKGWLAEIHRSLKPGGVLGVVQHRAKDDANPDESSKQGYLPEKFVISEIEAAGFKLAGKSEINANPKDTKDYAAGVWALPPSLEGGDKDKDKFLAIGESDRMTLKFTKVAAPKAPAAAKAAPAPKAAPGKK